MSEPIENILHDLEGLHKQSTQGEWGKGLTSHHTIRKEDNYPIATFKHANDASFVDFAHKFVPDLIAEVRRLQAQEVQQLRRLSDEEIAAIYLDCATNYKNVKDAMLAKGAAQPVASETGIPVTEQPDTQANKILALLDSDLAFCHEPMGQEALDHLCSAIKQILVAGAAQPAVMQQLVEALKAAQAALVEVSPCIADTCQQAQSSMRDWAETKVDAALQAAKEAGL